MYYYVLYGVSSGFDKWLWSTRLRIALQVSSGLDSLVLGEAVEAETKEIQGLSWKDFPSAKGFKGRKLW